jgi:hypothetical protein
MILSVKPSTLKNKRYMAVFRKEDGTERIFHFGYKYLNGSYGYTYIDGADETTRENYRKRHLGNATENRLIKSLTPSASLFSYYLLWGDSRSLETNIKRLNNLMRK